MLTGFFREAPPSLWPRAVVIEHLSRNEWQDDCIADMRARGYAETGRTRSNTLLVRVPNRFHLAHAQVEHRPSGAVIAPATSRWRQRP